MPGTSLPCIYIIVFGLIVLAFSQEVDSSAKCSDKGRGECPQKEPDVFNAITDISNQLSKFLTENVFTQKREPSSDSGYTFPKFKETDTPDPLKDLMENVGNFFLDFNVAAKDDAEIARTPQQNKILEEMLTIAKRKTDSRSFDQVLGLFMDVFQQAVEQMRKTLENVNMEHLSPFGMWYYIERMDEARNPSWKRRNHRFHKQVSIDSIIELHDALFLSHLSYSLSVEYIKETLKTFKNNALELVYAKTESLPGEPAHFIAIHKESVVPKNDWLSTIGLKKVEDQPLEVVIVVRGTKEIGDMFSDALLGAIDFRQGKGHAGIAGSGEWLVAEHLELLHSLTEASKRKKLKVTLIGHSLGAAVAAMAAMILNEEEWIDVFSIGFGCPAILDVTQSLAVQDYVVTVVTDSDVVPRMSGATIVNVLLDIMSFDWTSKALEDLELTLEWLRLPNKEGIMKWAEGIMDKFDRPFFKQVSEIRMEQVLFPPGNCIHFFRDGIGFTATFTPCSFFRDIEVSRSMVSDHMIPTGYHRAFLELLRDKKKNLGEDFVHDLMSLRV